MNSVSTNDVLNRILVLHSRSLAVYLTYAPPWQMVGLTEAMTVIKQVADDHQRTVDRLAAIILENGGTVDHGEFPMSFTSLHDLSAAYLVNLAIERQQKVISAVEKLADMLALSPFAQATAREVVGEAKGHLQNLQELQQQLNQPAATHS
ncbi:MAG: hypothetical protein ACO1RA_14225 [Planctomycetaceae bacterium]